MSIKPVEGVEGLHEVSLGDGRLLAEHRRAEELAVALVGPVLLGQLESRVSMKCVNIKIVARVIISL